MHTLLDNTVYIRLHEYAYMHLHPYDAAQTYTLDACKHTKDTQLSILR